MATVKTATLFSVVGFTAATVVAVVAGLRTNGHSTASPHDSSAPRAVDIEATSIYHFDSLDEMVAASDTVVLATVVSTDRGPPVGEPGGNVIVSRLLTLSVESTLAGPRAENLVVEEEGWLSDGTPVRVNGVEPSEVGDRGVWFLDTITEGDQSTALVVNSQGRFLARPDGSLVGGDQRDALVRQLEAKSLDELMSLIKS